MCVCARAHYRYLQRLVVRHDDLSRVDVPLEEQNGRVEDFAREHNHRRGAVANLAAAADRKHTHAHTDTSMNRESRASLSRTSSLTRFPRVPTARASGRENKERRSLVCFERVSSLMHTLLTSSSCARLSSIMLLAAGWDTSTSRKMQLPFKKIKTAEEPHP